MKKKTIIFLIICLLNLSCTLKKNSVVINSLEDSRTAVNCSYPFTPSNNLVLFLFYKDAMHYLTHSDDICRHSFAKKLKEEVQSSFFLSQGCIKATVDDINDALYHPAELRKRLNYWMGAVFFWLQFRLEPIFYLDWQIKDKGVKEFHKAFW